MIKKNFKIGLGLGFGGANAKNFNYNKKHKRIIENFISIGGSFVDTAGIYGKGTSENIIGSLPDNLKKKLFISTKISPENLNYNLFLNSVKQSLQRLKVKKIYLIQPHWPNYKINNIEIIKAYLKLKSDNLVEKFGLSNYEIDDIKYFKKKLKSDFCYIQERFSLGDFELLKKKINFCKKNNIKIICYSPLKSGNIHFDLKQKRILNKLQKKYNTSRSSLILAYILSKSEICIPIPYTVKEKHLNSNYNSTNLKISKKDIFILDNNFKTKFIKLKLKEVDFLDKNSKKIRSLDDAKKMKYPSPTPMELCKRLKNGYKIKDIILKKYKNKYQIQEGRIRFWANVLFFGWNRKIKFILN